MHRRSGVIRFGGQRLSPRVCQVAKLLLTGRSEKQIARRLSISQHTAHHYIKDAYRAFDVSSRPEFMARFVPLADAAPELSPELIEAAKLSVRLTSLLALVMGREEIRFPGRQDD